MKYLVFVLFLSFGFSAEIDKMLFRQVPTNYYTNWEYRVVLTGTNVTRWVVLPKPIEQFNVYLLMTGTTNGGYVETTGAPYSDLTNISVGDKWPKGNCISNTMDVLNNWVTAVRGVGLSNTITFYVTAGKWK